MNDLFIQSIKIKALEVVKVLLNDPKVDPTFNNDDGIIIAIRNRDVEMVKLLLNDPRVDPTMKYRNSFYKGLAFAGTHSDIISLLMDSGHPLPIAIKYGYIEIVKLLLADSRVLESASDMRFLKTEYPEIYIKYVIRKKYAISRIKEWWISIIHHPEHPFFLKEIEKELADQN